MKTSRRGFAKLAALTTAATQVPLMSEADGAPINASTGSCAGLHLSTRFIPNPTSISPEAQSMMAAMCAESSKYVSFPSTGDSETWRKYVARKDAEVLAMISPALDRFEADVEEFKVGAASVYAITPQNRMVEDRLVWLDIHGGALVQGGGELCKAFGMGTAARYGSTVWAVDYRMPPDHPYPAPLDDCVAAYRQLLRRHAPEEIVVGGGSAGGNLAAALILRARDEGLPLPAVAILGTPELDLTESGDSFQTNLGLDARLQASLMPANLLYANGHDLKHPYLSPLFGDFSKGFPPTFLSAGTRDLFMSNAVRMHWALLEHNVPAELYLTEAGSHGGFQNCPEEKQMLRQTRRFLAAHWGRKA